MQTKELAAYLVQMNYDAMSDRTRSVVKKTVLDILGVAIAGSATKEAEIWQKYFLSYSTSESRASVWTKGLPSAGYRQAAGVNAAWGHILDFDDVHNLAIAHLGVVTVPGALAIAQSRHLSGTALMEGVAAGFEIGARVGHAINPSSYRFWHTTAVVGALSTCAAAGRLMNLSSDKMVHALGSAGTQAAGLWEFMSDGAMSKPLHTANATLCGIRSAELAELGLTGASRILEGDQGLLRALSQEYHPERLTEGLGGEYMISGNSFKLYPCCRHIHSAIYNMDKLLRNHRISPEQVRQIRSCTYDTAKNLTDRLQPATAYACKFSTQYCLSAILNRGGYDIGIFDAESMENPSIRALMPKVIVVSDSEMNAKIAADSTCWGNRLEIELHDGTVLAESTDYPPGDSHIPFPWEDALQKFHALSDPVIGHERAVLLAERISQLDQLDDVNSIFH